ncbi:MAG: hypothetical protein ACRD2P_04390 [Terriglobia bacterium]
MSEKTGDKARFGRERRKKIQQRQRTREVKRASDKAIAAITVDSAVQNSAGGQAKSAR